MFSRAAFSNIILFFSILLLSGLCSAQSYNFSFTTTTQQCTQAMARLTMSLQPSDSALISWSTGETSTFVSGASNPQIGGLNSGSYYVNVHVKHHRDTLVHGIKDSVILVIKDTTINFTIDKEECPVSIGKYFSPNDDGYTDVMGIGNVEHYPNFELEIFNKWGQRVHHQRGPEYKPWDGTWLSVGLPDGVYYYVFFYDAGNRKNLLKGDITILR